jgi:DHA2 family multidrug resistance protein
MVIAFTYFIAHTALTPAHKSFVDYRLLKNGNYVTGLMFIFIVGLVMYATRALTPTMLEDLLDYPVATTGLVTAPAGFGTMLSMLIAGRIVGKVDLRLILLTGFLFTLVALWQMTRYSLGSVAGRHHLAGASSKHSAWGWFSCP